MSFRKRISFFQDFRKRSRASNLDSTGRSLGHVNVDLDGLEARQLAKNVADLVRGQEQLFHVGDLEQRRDGGFQHVGLRALDPFDVHAIDSSLLDVERNKPINRLNISEREKKELNIEKFIIVP